MKFVLTTMLLGFLVLSCKKEKEVSTNSTSDSTVVTGNNNDTMQTVIPPRTSDSTMTTESAPASDIDTVSTGRSSR